MPEIDSLLRAPSPAVLTTYRKDGTAVTSPVWFRFQDNTFEVVIARDDQVCLGRRRDGQHSVVVRVPARGLRQWRRLDNFGQPAQFAHHAPRIRLGAEQDRSKLAATHDLGKLVQQCRGTDDCEVTCPCLFDQRMRRAVPKQARNQHIGINDDPHAADAAYGRPSLPR